MGYPGKYLHLHGRDRHIASPEMMETAHATPTAMPSATATPGGPQMSTDVAITMLMNVNTPNCPITMIVEK